MIFGIVNLDNGTLITLSHDIESVIAYLIANRLNSAGGAVFSEVCDHVDHVQMHIDEAHYNYPRAKCINLTNFPVVMPEPEPFIFNALLHQHVALN